MIQKINLRESVNALTELFRYKRVGTLNNHMLNVLQAENRTFKLSRTDGAAEFNLQFALQTALSTCPLTRTELQSSEAEASCGMQL